MNQTSRGKKVYANLKPKEKKAHLALLEEAVIRAKENLRRWESSLEQLKKEMGRNG